MSSEDLIIALREENRLLRLNLELAETLAKAREKECEMLRAHVARLETQAQKVFDDVHKINNSF